MSVGQRLRQARLNAGLTLDRVSDTTKIPLWILHSIECDDLSHIPGGVFVRGYFAAFARAVGLDPHEILTAHFGPPREPAVVEPPEVRRPVYTGTPLWQVAALIALVAATAFVWRDAWAGRAGEAGGARTPRAIPASAVEHETPPVVTAATSGHQTPALVAASNISRPTEPNEPPAPAEPHPLVVQLHATSAVWIEATADGERKAYRLFNPGEDETVNAQQEVHLLIGDASAVTYSVNGVAASPLGAAGVVREFTITPESIASTNDR